VPWFPTPFCHSPKEPESAGLGIARRPHRLLVLGQRYDAAGGQPHGPVAAGRSPGLGLLAEAQVRSDNPALPAFPPGQGQGARPPQSRIWFARARIALRKANGAAVPPANRALEISMERTPAAYYRSGNAHLLLSNPTVPLAALRARLGAAQRLSGMATTPGPWCSKYRAGRRDQKAIERFGRRCREDQCTGR